MPYANPESVRDLKQYLQECITHHPVSHARVEHFLIGQKGGGLAEMVVLIYLTADTTDDEKALIGTAVPTTFDNHPIEAILTKVPPQNLDGTV